MRYILLNILLFSFTFSNAQEVTFERISAEQGLSQNDVLAIYKDSRGYFWFSTHDGLNRYDGYEFKVFRNSKMDSNSVGSNLFRNIVEDKNNNLWISQQSNGFTRYNYKTGIFTQKRGAKYGKDSAIYNGLNHIFIDSRDRLWVSTFKGCGVVLDTQKEKIELKYCLKIKDSYPQEFIKVVYQVIETKRGEILLLSDNGIYSVEFDSDGMPTGYLSVFFKDSSINFYRSLIELDDKFLISSNNSLSLVTKYEGNNSYLLRHLIHGVSFIEMVKDANGNIWCGGPNGLTQFKYTNDASNPLIEIQSFTEGREDFNLSNDYVRCLYVDDFQAVWIGTVGGGLCKYDPDKKQFRKFSRSEKKGSLTKNKILSIFEDSQKNIWFGTQGGGLNLLPFSQAKNYNSGFEQFDVKSNNSQNSVRQIIEVGDSLNPELWASTDYHSGIVKVKQENGKWKIKQFDNLPAREMTMALCKDENGTVWVGTYNGGLYKAIPHNKNYRFEIYTTNNSNLPSDIIRSILEDSQGRLWVGTSKGLAVLPKDEKLNENPEFIVFQNEARNIESLSHNYIIPLMEDKDGQIWIGTLGGGANIFEANVELSNGKFRRFNTSHGLPNNVIKSFVQDDFGKIWISSNKGLTQYDPQDKSIINYDKKDGLQDSEFGEMAATKLHDGEIIFGGVNGFNTFYPQEIKKDSVPPKIVFTKFELINKELKIGELINKHVILEKSINELGSIQLRHRENNFTLHFAALHYAVPNSNQYKYMLDGFDEEWIRTSASSRFAKYTNLQPGEYVFKVLASNKDGVWTTEPKELIIKVQSPFWATAWFKIIIIILVVLAIYYRFRLVKIKNDELEKLVNKRTMALNDKNNELIRQSEALAETNVLLEERQQQIEEQTEELQSQNEYLEELNATKDRFYSILAHDLKNPFNILLGFLELLKSKYKGLSEESRDVAITNAHESANRIYKLTDNLLEWSRAQRGLIKFKPEKIRLKDCLINEIDLLRDMAASKSVSIEYDNELPTFELVADLYMLSTVFRNLISNAIKFTNKNGVIKILLDSSSSNEIVFLVEDNGIGIPNDVIPNIFRVDVNNSRKGTAEEKGTGLGLVLCKEFVKKHKGKIWVESEENVGTKFYFTIPKSIQPMKPKNLPK